VARALDEPLAGTAPSAGRWLCLEHPEPWPYDITRHPEPAIRDFLNRAAASGFRPLLIRRPGNGRNEAVRRVLLADTDPARAEVTLQTTAGLDALAELRLPDPRGPLPGDRAAAGVPLLICTHADRDHCCGVDGRDLVDALVVAGEPDVWESSHLGGHRFAPTALVLPTGYLYGRLDLRSGAAVRAAAASGAVVIESCRGRSTWSPEGQVAELAVRAVAGLRSAADLVVLANDNDGPVVVRARSGARWEVEVEVVDVDTVRPPSCGARPRLMVPLRAGSVRRM
jgi:hypothetical protein